MASRARRTLPARIRKPHREIHVASSVWFRCRGPAPRSRRAMGVRSPGDYSGPIGARRLPSFRAAGGERSDILASPCAETSRRSITSSRRQRMRRSGRRRCSSCGSSPGRRIRRRRTRRCSSGRSTRSRWLRSGCSTGSSRTLRRRIARSRRPRHGRGLRSGSGQRLPSARAHRSRRATRRARGGPPSRRPEPVARRGRRR